MIVARPISNQGPSQRRERDVAFIDELRRGDLTTAGPPSSGKKGVSRERPGSTNMKEPIRFSAAFCVWLLIGGPQL